VPRAIIIKPLQFRSGTGVMGLNDQLNAVGDLRGKSALITGAGRGIGQRLAVQLARCGAAVVVNDLDSDPTHETVSEIESAGGQAVACAGSVTADDFPQRFIDTALDTFGRIDIIVNNAGYIWNDPIDRIEDDQWDAIQDVHLKAPFRILRAAAPHIKQASKEEASRGERVVRKIVNVSSVSATQGAFGQANYAAAKAGLIGLTRTLSKEWGRFNVTVNCVAFGYVETRLTATSEDDQSIQIGDREHRVGLRPDQSKMTEMMIPLGRKATPEEAANGALLLCLPESDYISGQVIEVAGGL